MELTRTTCGITNSLVTNNSLVTTRNCIITYVLISSLVTTRSLSITRSLTSLVITTDISRTIHRSLTCFNSLSLKQLTPTKRRKQNRVHAIRKGCDGIRNSLKNRIRPKRKKSNRLLRRRILNRIHSLSILGQIRRIYPIRESIGKNRL